MSKPRTNPPADDISTPDIIFMGAIVVVLLAWFTAQDFFRRLRRGRR